MGCQRATRCVLRARGWVGGERRSCLYRPVGSRGCGEIGVLVRRCMSKMSRQAARRKGAPAGAKGLVAGEHVPDRFGELAGEVDLGDLGAALAAEAALGVLIALGVVGVLARVQGGLEERPAQVLGALFGDRAAGVD